MTSICHSGTIRGAGTWAKTAIREHVGMDSSAFNRGFGFLRGVEDFEGLPAGEVISAGPA